MKDTEPVTAPSMALLEVTDLKRHFPVRGGFFKRVVGQLKAVDGVSFSIEKQRTLGLVGESGCGKSTLGRALLRLIEPTSGDVHFEGESLLGLSRSEMTEKRKDLQIIFQDPYGSLNPRMTVYEIIREPLDNHRVGVKRERRAAVEELLETVGLNRRDLNRYPHEFSGGQRQRVGIARALALRPKFIVGDEPVSALDVSVQSQVLNLISRLQDSLGIALLFISHDLAVVQHISHEVAVMYLGKIVEKASVQRLYSDPKHPYTRALLAAVPIPDPATKRKKIILGGDVPSAVNPPPGCPFHPRCPEAEPACSEVVPRTVNVATETDPHFVNCHLYTEPD